MTIFEQLNLFSDELSSQKLYDNNKKCSSNYLKKVEKLPIEQGEIFYYPNFFDREKCDFLYRELERTIQWKQENIKFYGKSIALPRLTAWYGEPEKYYIYSGIEMKPLPWIEVLLFIKREVELVSEARFNSVLLNFYRDGKDGVAWHSDDEPELGVHPVIGSVSLGGGRRFMLKQKAKNSNQKYEIELAHGSLLLMRGATQEYWLHQIPKTKKQVEPRINLTFRTIH